MKHRCFCGKKFANCVLYKNHSKNCEMTIEMKLYNLTLYVHSLSHKCDKIKKEIIAMHHKISSKGIE